MAKAFNISDPTTWPDGAFVLRTDGGVRRVKPAGRKFTESEVLGATGIEQGYMEFVRPVICPGWYMIVDEMGHPKELPLNAAASWIYGTQDHGHPIAGDVLMVKAELLG